MLPLGVLTVGADVFGFVLYGTFVPFPAAPFNMVVFAAGASAMIGVAVAVIPRGHRRLAHSDLIRATHRPVMSVSAEA